MNKQILFDDVAEAEPIEDPGLRVLSTPETQARYQFLKKKRKGDCWEENGQLYRMGACGVISAQG